MYTQSLYIVPSWCLIKSLIIQKMILESGSQN